MEDYCHICSKYKVNRINPTINNICNCDLVPKIRFTFSYFSGRGIGNIRVKNLCKTCLTKENCRLLVLSNFINNNITIKHIVRAGPRQGQTMIFLKQKNEDYLIDIVFHKKYPIEISQENYFNHDDDWNAFDE